MRHPGHGGVLLKTAKLLHTHQHKSVHIHEVACATLDEKHTPATPCVAGYNN